MVSRSLGRFCVLTTYKSWYLVYLMDAAGGSTHDSMLTASYEFSEHYLHLVRHSAPVCSQFPRVLIQSVFSPLHIQHNHMLFSSAW